MRGRLLERLVEGREGRDHAVHAHEGVNRRSLFRHPAQDGLRVGPVLDVLAADPPSPEPGPDEE